MIFSIQELEIVELLNNTLMKEEVISQEDKCANEDRFRGILEEVKQLKEKIEDAKQQFKKFEVIVRLTGVLLMFLPVALGQGCKNICLSTCELIYFVTLHEYVPNVTFCDMDFFSREWPSNTCKMT